MATDRRTVLSLLGLASATAVGSETFMAPPAKAGEVQNITAAYETERFAAAFEKLAAGIRSGQIEVHSLGITSDLRRSCIADVHDLRFTFRHLPEI